MQTVKIYKWVLKDIMKKTYSWHFEPFDQDEPGFSDEYTVEIPEGFYVGETQEGETAFFTDAGEYAELVCGYEAIGGSPNSHPYLRYGRYGEKSVRLKIVDDENGIKNARIDAGLTQAAMAEAFEIPLRTLKHWENGSRRPPEWAEKLILEKLEHMKMENKK